MRNRNTIVVLMAGLTLAFGAQAGKPVKQDASEGNAAYAGVRVAIDPATGRLRQPTAAEVAALRTAVRQSGAQPTFKGQPRTEAEAYKTIRRLRDGSVMAMFPESLMSNVVATQQADGSLRIQHVGADGVVEDIHAAEVTK